MHGRRAGLRAVKRRVVGKGGKVVTRTYYVRDRRKPTVAAKAAPRRAAPTAERRARIKARKLALKLRAARAKVMRANKAVQAQKRRIARMKLRVRAARARAAAVRARARKRGLRKEVIRARAKAARARIERLRRQVGKAQALKIRLQARRARMQERVRALRAKAKDKLSHRAVVRERARDRRAKLRERGRAAPRPSRASTASSGTNPERGRHWTVEDRRRRVAAMPKGRVMDACSIGKPIDPNADASVRHTADVMSKMHKHPIGKKVPVRGYKPRDPNEEGLFTGRCGEPQHIQLRGMPGHITGLTFAHEYGHHLDLLMGNPHQSNTHWEGWGSKHNNELLTTFLNNPAMARWKATWGARDPEFHAYIVRPHEMFARAYTQWIAHHGGSGALRTEFDRVNASMKRSHGTHDHWEPHEFAPIAIALERHLRHYGLL